MTSPDSCQRQDIFIRNTLLLSFYKHIVAMADGATRIVPLKGVDLLQDIYASTLQREVADIDILTTTTPGAMIIVQKLLAKGYKPEFNFALTPSTISAKGKVSLISPDPYHPNIDIHIRLVTKKFFAPSVDRFCHSAISRLRAITPNEMRLDPVDRVLFLAQHGAFHHFWHLKWVRDIALCIGALSGAQRDELMRRSHDAGFDRIMAYTRLCLAERDPEILNLLPEFVSRRSTFYTYLKRCHKISKRHPSRGLDRWFWEFLFIAKRSERFKAYMRIMLPSPGFLANIYRTSSKLAISALYILHVPMIAIALPLRYLRMNLTRLY